jgi:hypothetical protein
MVTNINIEFEIKKQFKNKNIAYSSSCATPRFYFEATLNFKKNINYLQFNNLFKKLRLALSGKPLLSTFCFFEILINYFRYQLERTDNLQRYVSAALQMQPSRDGKK